VPLGLTRWLLPVLLVVLIGFAGVLPSAAATAPTAKSGVPVVGTWALKFTLLGHLFSGPITFSKNHTFKAHGSSGPWSLHDTTLKFSGFTSPHCTAADFVGTYSHAKHTARFKGTLTVTCLGRTSSGVWSMTRSLPSTGASHRQTG
jgi:hypothetical protein